MAAATVFGMPAVGDLARPASPEDSPSLNTLRDGQMDAAARQDVGSARTMFGMPAMVEAVKAEMDAKRAAHTAEPVPQNQAHVAGAAATPTTAVAEAAPVKKPRAIAPNRTMLGVPVKAPEAKREPMPTMAGARFETQAFTIDGTIAGIPATSKSRLKIGLGLGLLLSLLLAMSLGGYLYYASLPRSSAALANSGGQRVLDVQVLRGSWQRVRALGGEATFANGRAQVPVGANALEVGEQTYEITLVDAAGNTHVDRLLLTVAYTIETDLAHVQDWTQPRFTLRVHVPNGATVKVDDRAVAVSGGVAALEVPIENPALRGQPAPAAGYLEISKNVEVLQGSENYREAVATRIAFSGLRIDAPGEIFYTNAPFQLIGRVDRGAQIRLGGAVSDGRVVTPEADGRFSIPLAPASCADASDCVFSVQAVAPGKLVSSHIIRVVPSIAANHFNGVRSLRYEELSTAGDGDVVVRGEVYNVQTDGPRRVLQMLTTPCAGADRCPVWVEYDEVRPIASGARVRVRGRYAGTQEFRTAAGESRTVPKINAMLVLPE